MKKQFVWVLAATLSICGTTATLTSCSDDTEETAVVNNPLSNKLEGMWYAETAEQGSFPGWTEGDPERNYTKVINAYRFFADGTGLWEKFYVNDNGEVANVHGDLVYAEGSEAAADGFFHYSSATDGTVCVTFAHADVFNKEAHISAARTLHYDGDSISEISGADACQLKLADNEKQEEIMVYANSAHCGSIFDNINELYFNSKNWRSQDEIALYDGGNRWARALKGYYMVALPWSKKDKLINMDENFCDDITPENGWELAFNRCGNNEIKNNNFLGLYNKYTGILRIFYYVPENFKAGNDHFWEILMNNELANRSTLQYSIPQDKSIVNLSALGLAGPGNEIPFVVTPWTNSNNKGLITPNEGWWAFDIDLSGYRPASDTSKDFIRLQMRSRNMATTSLFTALQGEINGTLDADMNIKQVTKEEKIDLSTTACLGKLFSLSKSSITTVKEGVKGYTDGEWGKVASSVASLGALFGIGASTSGKETLDLEGKFKGTLTLGMQGNAETTGIINEAQPVSGVKTPTIYLDKFNYKSHVGKGIWSLKSSPVVYMTNKMLSCFQGGLDLWDVEGRAPQYGCMYFFDPSSVELVLNPSIFPEKDIEWIEVNSFCGTRLTNTVTSTDYFRQAIGLSSRVQNLTKAEDYLYGMDWKTLSGEHCNDAITRSFDTHPGDFPNQDVVGDFFYGMDQSLRKEFKYDVTGPIEKVDDMYQSYYGAGNKSASYVMEPQMATCSWEKSCIAPPLEINVQVRIKMKNMDEVISYNRIYLPEFKTVKATKEELMKLYNVTISGRSVPAKCKDHMDMFFYNKKRIYDKIRFLYPDAPLKDIRTQSYTSK